MQLAVLILMVGVVAALVFTLVRLRKSNFSLLANRGAQKTRDNFEVLKPCPLCGTMLRRGETVHSVVFSGGTKAANATTTANTTTTRPADYLTHIFGCPYCHPANPGHPRKCPVCEKIVPEDGHVIARMFDKPGKKHVHVLGCTQCRRSR
ncbi:MAG: hypothetical protein KOO61_05410 [Spirochaetales bacterium]|nr:hypothetical protein [Spirochaetales bacterium]